MEIEDIMYDNPWLLEGKPFDPADEEIADQVGFIYKLTNQYTGRMYIGKKNFWQKRKNSKGKRVTKQSDWRNYYGSNEEIKYELQYTDKFAFKREILLLAAGAKQLSYFETRELFVRGVLESNDYYNETILGKFYAKDTKHGKTIVAGTWWRPTSDKTAEELMAEHVERKKELFKDSVFINDGMISKRVKRSQLPKWLKRGWETGRLPWKHKRKVQCPHCEKIGAEGGMMRYHFENCKFKKMLDLLPEYVQSVSLKVNRKTLIAFMSQHGVQCNDHEDGKFRPTNLLDRCVELYGAKKVRASRS